MAPTGEADGETPVDELERLYELLYLLPVGVVAYAADGAVTAINPLTIQLLSPFVGPTGSDDALQLLAPLVDDPRELVSVADRRGPLRRRRTLRRRDGDLVTIDLAVHRTGTGEYVAVVSDVTDVVRREAQLRRERDRMKVIVEVVQYYAIFTIDNTGRVDTWNASGERLFGRSEADVLGRPLVDLLELAADDVDDLLQVAVGVGWNGTESWTSGAGGQPFYADTMVSTLVDETGRPDGFAVIVRDATEVREREDRLRTEATTDPLTALPNRRGFDIRLGQLVEACRVSGAPLSVLMLDLDHFKSVNDSHGHGVGDIVLRVVADRLVTRLRSTDVVARLGGEEFVVLLPGADRTAAVATAENLRRAIGEEPIAADADLDVLITISIGVVECLGDPTTSISRADAALYEAKNTGRNRVVAG